MLSSVDEVHAPQRVHLHLPHLIDLGDTPGLEEGAGLGRWLFVGIRGHAEGSGGRDRGARA
jgi:hypothetical protein